VSGLPVKIAVYTIALNEAAHAERWAESAADADYRIVADTGSSDDTVERLTRARVTVHRIAVRPWRFDVARNTAMALIPDDVDVCCTMDMDRFLEPGWRPRLEAAWTPGTTALFGRVVYRATADDPAVLRGWPAKNFHHRWGYRFKRAVHEALTYTGEEVTRDCADIVMCEVQDHGKETRRQYLSLMELAHQEDPDDAQICFWLGRDYMWANRYEESIPLLERYLSLPTSTWTEERSEAMRYLARMQPDKKMLWLDKARNEAPHRREIWLDLAEELHGQADWLNLFWACTNGVEKTHRTGSYLDDAHCWGFRLYDLGAIAAWHLNVMDRAVYWGEKALELATNDQRPRLQNNLNFFAHRRAEINVEHIRASVRDEIFSRLGRQPCTLLQVGANDGKSLNELIRKYGWSGVLIEPVPFVFEELTLLSG
jgi:glycosyltransferase involved in cell wall biosynthesis